MAIVDKFIKQMKAGEFCNGDAHMAIYITDDGRVLDGIKRVHAASITTHPLLVKVVPNTFTKEDVQKILDSHPDTCTCGKRC